MNNTFFNYPMPKNEPIKAYLPNSLEKIALKKSIEKISSEAIEIPLIIGGKEVRTGKIGKVVMPHNHQHVLATYHQCTEKEVNMAIEAALKARKKWADTPFEQRAAILLKLADLISTKYRALIAASVMLGQSKNVFQAEIDTPCELVDFLRFNVHFAQQIYQNQPNHSDLTINKMDYRSLEGFVMAVTPFNFTAIASNLNLSPVLMGNVSVWKPSTTALLSNYYLMKIMKEAGLPDGVVNFIPGSGSLIGNICTNHKDFAGFHFTGSTGVFNSIWENIGKNLPKYRSYPKIVGETGGKDFIFAHKSADIDALAVAMVRGAYEFQGQKCSAASRAYVPESIWGELKEKIGKMLSEIKMGGVEDFTNMVNAVIDEASFDNCMNYINHAKNSADAEIIFGGNGDKSVGYFVEPTLIVAKKPDYKSMVEEIFGPILTVYIYKDEDFEKTLQLCDETSPYALTGSIFAQCRDAVAKAENKLQFAAGNFYINDKPTGAVVGQQPFGGSRASGTNDKAGSYLNLLRWCNPRSIKETLVPPTDYKYPFMCEN
ncbi:MAG: L-glutamate gamma-semialdehyde dehydrogenase [Bacteroidales bacterium]|jgi:1-pyrroline-5-carboxylate dehydrogenase|nr:L-glutamate gamma-semialdehyde dehydrogenase [Bacteroidales bacterium]